MEQKKEFLIKVSLTKKQMVCWKYLNDNVTEDILFGGAAGGGKSWLGCEWLLVNCIRYPGTSWFIARNELKRIMKSTYRTFIKVCHHHKIPDEAWKLNSQQNYIEFWNGSRIWLNDVAYKPADPLYERFGSEEYTSGWIEEAGEVRNQAYEVLKSRIGRNKNKEYGLLAKMFLSCNPKKNWLYFDFYKPDKEGILPSHKIFIKSLYKDNPFIATEYGKRLSRIKDKAMRERLREGNWEYENDDAALMKYEDIIEMLENNVSPDNNGDFCLSVDVARYGRDKCVMILWQGYFIKKIWSYDKSSTVFIEDKIKSICKKYHMEMSDVVVDQDGVGGGVVDHLPGVKSFINAARPVEEWDDDKKYRNQETDRYSYKNLRAQCYFKLAQMIEEHKLGCYELDPETRDTIIEELEIIKRKDVTDNEKKLQIISKEEIKDTLGRSPDYADAIMMRFFFSLGYQDDILLDNSNFEIEVC